MAQSAEGWDEHDPATMPKQKKQQQTGCGAIALGLGIVVGLGWALVTVFGGSHGASLADSDASARMACAHYSNIVTDATQGILGDDQLLPKLREVHTTARGSDNVAVSAAATMLLTAATQGLDVSAAASHMTNACLDLPTD